MLCRVMYVTNIRLILRGYILIWKASQILGSRERICILCCDSSLLPYSSLLLTIRFRPDRLVIRTTPLSSSQYHSPTRYSFVLLILTFWQGTSLGVLISGFSLGGSFSFSRAFYYQFIFPTSQALTNSIFLVELDYTP